MRVNNQVFIVDKENDATTEMKVTVQGHTHLYAYICLSYSNSSYYIKTNTDITAPGKNYSRLQDAVQDTCKALIHAKDMHDEYRTKLSVMNDFVKRLENINDDH